MKSATIGDVATLAGVSKSTVSAVLNHKSIVKESTRQSVLRAMDELNYRPTGAARQRFQASNGVSVGFIVKESNNPYYAEVQEGIQEVARQRDFTLYVISSDGCFEKERRIVEQCVAHDFSGLIIAPTLNDDTDLLHLFELKRQNVPFVLLERLRGLQAHLVDVDNVDASCAAAKYLIEKGHSRIIHFGGPPYSEHSKERADGVRRAFSESHLAFNTSMIVDSGDSLTDGYQAALLYFRNVKERNRPTAVTCYNDLVAIGVIRALGELGLSVPDDVSVVGFDDIKMLEYLPFGLTTVHIPKFEMGKLAAEVLFRNIDANSSQNIEKYSLDAQLVVRESTRSLSPVGQN